MANVLYITAHPLTEDQSFSLATGKAFLDQYVSDNPHDQVTHVDLYKEYIPEVDADVLSGWGKLGNGEDFSSLAEAEQTKVARLGELNEQFISNDKYVFVTPLWNFTFPPVLKAYMDAVAVPGKCFRYTENGPEGLLTDKKAVHIQARGGIYSEGPAAEMEMGHRFIATMMGFFGVPSVDHVVAEGHSMQPDQAQEIKTQAIAEAKELAQTF
ncbi:FMN-dependent NADH-azoreductase [Salisediminibacterium halotolerans]|uniref:FMN dependent NADH:quinone oxidoreductase n=1 Tax=Salisediminibacterium halotolerans TaxID=517425 RepID=A0A1H9SKX4_9BACI|nr:FMN-dependent NADH-azoreductase [Salisediminibacterium haloalkalitolerans]SER84909.1 FMN-dependent NADH-azoreductase [Salisediminibacterium haloalkalitolerans]